MKFNLGILLMLSLLIGFAIVSGRTNAQQPGDSACDMVAHALTDSQQIKPGNVRGEVEKTFTRDGGAQFPNSTRYVYKKCRYLHIDVEFELKAVPGQLFSADDVVAKTSKLYVDYSAKD